MIKLYLVTTFIIEIIIHSYNSHKIPAELHSTWSGQVSSGQVRPGQVRLG